MLARSPQVVIRVLLYGQSRVPHSLRQDASWEHLPLPSSCTLQSVSHYPSPRPGISSKAEKSKMASEDGPLTLHAWGEREQRDTLLRMAPQRFGFRELF